MRSKPADCRLIGPVAAGSPVPGPLMSKLSDPENGFGLTELTITYGMTETSPASLCVRNERARLILAA